MNNRKPKKLTDYQKYQLEQCDKELEQLKKEKEQKEKEQKEKEGEFQKTRARRRT